MSIITLHDGHYQSELPLGRHSASSVSQVVTSLEQEWVAGPLGLGSRVSWLSGPQGRLSGQPMLSEHAAEASNGIPIFSSSRVTPTAKRARKASNSPARRLFAVGEDCALAALRSAVSQLATRASALDGVGGGTRRLELWTAAPDLLLSIAAEMSHLVPQGVQVLVFAVLPPGSSMVQSKDKLKFWQHELSLQEGNKMQIETVTLCASEFAKKIRAPLNVQFNLLLRLPSASGIRGLVLVAAPGVLLPLKRRRVLAASATAGCTFEVLSRLPVNGVSCELVYGVPLLAFCYHSQIRSSFVALVCALQRRSECLLATAKLHPVSFALCKSTYYYIVSPSDAYAAPALTFRGVAFADVWNPMSMLLDDHASNHMSAKPPNDYQGLKAHMAPSTSRTTFDPYTLHQGLAKELGP